MQIQNVEAIYPLTPLQEAFLSGTESDASSNQFIFDLKGSLDPALFEKCCQQVIARNSGLRTSFVSKAGGKPLQVVYKDIKLAFEHLDWNGLSADQQNLELDALLKADRARGFVLLKPPLTRVLLCKMGEGHHVLIWSCFRLLMDRLSARKALEEALSNYESFRLHREMEPKPSASYRDYLAWLKQQDLSGSECFWKDELSALNGPYSVAVSRPLRDESPPSYDRRQIELSEQTTASFRAFLSKHEISPAAFFCGLWSLVLSRYTARDEVIFGGNVTNRPAEVEGAESAIGFFENMLPVRLTIPLYEPVLQWLVQIRARLLHLRRYETVPLQQICRWADLTESVSLFESCVNLDGFAQDGSGRWSSGSLEIAEIEGFEQGRIPLAFDAADGQMLQLRLTFDKNIFHSTLVELMLQHARTLMERIFERPDQLLSELLLANPESMQRKLAEWNATETAYPGEQTLKELFEAQVEQSPDAIAVVGDNSQVTYRELNARSNQLAHHLLSIGITEEVVVGVCLGRSVDMIVAILAVVKAGGAYMPLDPTYPVNRISFMLEDADVQVLLTEDSLLTDLPVYWAQVICMDSDWEIISRQSSENPSPEMGSENLAYLMYTSGSTGQPKGVSINHRGIVRLVRQTNYAEFGPTETFLQLAPISFDASTFEIWGCLLNGGSLVLLSNATPSLNELGQAIRQYQVTTLWLTAGLFHLMVDERVEDLARLRQLLAGGDVLSSSHVSRAVASLEHGRLINGYGPTESTTFACCYPVIDAHAINGFIPIGRPISNTTIHLLDGWSRQVPLGVAGFLYIGGDGLARCYHKRPELTASRFVPDPFGLKPGARLYDTRDLARYTPDGELEFLGRIDNQVKIRGFRVELEEIEVALSRHPAVRQLAVIAREDVPGEKHLVAYVVCNDGQGLTASEMREFLREKLPVYMIPPQVVLLDALPLTANGKVDRGALPAPGAIRSDDTYVAPETAEQLLLADVWSQVLGLDRIGLHDNFFDLGGDSIRIIQIRAKVQKRGFDFTVPQLFQFQTIFELARELKPIETELQPALQEPFTLLAEPDRLKMPDDIEDAYPLAMLQAGMLFHSEYSPDSALYHDIFSLKVQGRYDLPEFRATLEQVVARHPALRSSFHLIGYSEPLQFVHKKVELRLEVEDLSLIPEEGLREHLTAFIASEKARPFDWSKPSLIRFYLFKRSEESFQFVLSFHHAILDGWSLACLLAEIFGIYSSMLGEETFEVKPLLFTPGDFVALEKKALESDECRRFWAEELKDATITNLPYRDFSRPDSGRGLRSEDLSPKLVDSIKKFSQKASVPLKSVLLAAHLRVLSAVSGQSRAMTGMVTNGRPEAQDADRALGLFLNTVPFNLNMPGGTWIDLAQATFSAEQKILAWRRYPLAEIQKDRGGESLFETDFNFVHFHVLQNLLTYKNIEVVDAESYAVTSFAMAVSFALDPMDSRLSIRFDYDASKLSDARIESLAGYYVRTLTAMAEEPDSRYEHYSLLSAQELQQLLSEWNDTKTAYPTEMCLHQLFEAQVRRTPDCIAVEFDDEQITFDELNRRSNQLARHLRTLGVGPDTLVGVLMERSSQMVIALLGTLKAGGAYLPLDTAYPKQRLKFILDDSGVSVLLTNQQHTEDLPECSARVVSLDGDWDKIVAQRAENPVTEISSDNLAYVIYTSGSTGQPKGAMVVHKGLCNHMIWMQKDFPLSENDSVLQKTPFTFDASVWEFFAPLVTGARLIMARPGGHQDSSYLIGTIRERSITTLQLVPMLLRMLLEESDLETCDSLRRVFYGGESLALQLKDEFLKRLDVDLINLYGPTETTIEIASWACNRKSKESIIPIGRPITNARVYLLNSFHQPVGSGVPGELHIGGHCVGRGYLNRPELTAQKFIPDPFTDEPGLRLYKTGDLARYLPDGNIDLTGRTDFQVKIRGFRIELGELEAVLQQHPAIRDAVASVREDSPGDKRLVAYVVYRQEPAPSIAEVRKFVKSRLPEYMTPSTFVILDAMPLLPNGKIDRRSLPAPDLSRPDLERAYVAPRNRVEKTLTKIWSELLGVSEVGIHDDFFELGGQSLLATRAVSRVREALQIDLPLRSLFENPTVAELAKRLGTGNLSENEELALPIPKASRDGDLPLSFAQQRLWIIHRLEPDNPAYNIPALVRLTGDLNFAALQQAINEVLRRHEALRTTFITSNGRPAQQISEKLTLEVPVMDLKDLPEAEREHCARHLITQEIWQPFDLAKGPTVRAHMLQLDSDENVILLTMHHIVSDAWSMGVLVREMAELYKAGSAGTPSPLPELAIQYADYAIWQRGLLQDEVISEQLDYWKRQLSEQPAVLALPTDRPRLATQSYRGASRSITLGRELTQSLKEISRQEGATLFMTLLAAFKVLLYHYTKQEDIIIGSPIAGRNRNEVEDMIGFFINALVLRTGLSGNPSFRDLLGRVRETTLGAYAHQDLPFDKLVEEFQAGRDRTLSPLFQVAFTLDNTPREVFDLPGLTLNPMAIETETTRYDLVLALSDADDSVEGSFQYKVDLFDSSTISEMRRNYELVLSRIIAQPDSRLSEIEELISQAATEMKAERRAEFNQARRRMLKNAKQKSGSGLTSGIEVV
ncbi:MAG: amino acid adenylation domain-containing protein [Blastocatellia bacterium]